MPHLNSDDKKKRFTYKACCFVLVAFFVYLGVFLILPCIVPISRHLQNILGLGFVLSFIPLIIAALTLERLKLTIHYETTKYTLPYKTRNDFNLHFVLLGFFILIIISMLLNPLTWDTVIAVSVMLPLIGLLILAMVCNGVILFDDHLIYYVFWIKNRINFEDITEIKFHRGRTYYLTLITLNQQKLLNEKN